MLGKHSLIRLFDSREINVPVTIFDRTDVKFGNYCKKQLWFSTIRECLEQTLKSFEQTYHFQITSIKGKIYTLHCTGNQFID